MTMPIVSLGEFKSKAAQMLVEMKAKKQPIVLTHQGAVGCQECLTGRALWTEILGATEGVSAYALDQQLG